MHAFQPSEYEQRLDRVRQAMQRAGVDVHVATNPANMCYLTGYDGWSFYVHQLVLVVADEAQPFWIGRKMDAGAARVTTHLPHDQILGYPDEYVQSTVRHPMEYLADFLRARGWEKLRIGVEMDSYYYTAASHAALVARLPEARFANTNTLVNWVRCIKSPAEMEYIHRAARIIERVMQTAIEHVRPGVRQCDAAAEIYRTALRGTEEFGGDYPSIVPLLPSGEGTSTPHLTWTDMPFREGEATILELAGVHRRYHCPMARTVHLGKPPKKLADTAQIVVEGLGAALEAARPGATCEQVEAAWRQSIERHGIVKDSRLGYSIGLNYPPDWGEGTLSLRPGDRTVLEPNMTIHMIPGLWMDDWGIEISEAFLVTETGARTLASFPRQLIVTE